MPKLSAANFRTLLRILIVVFVCGGLSLSFYHYLPHSLDKPDLHKSEELAGGVPDRKNSARRVVNIGYLRVPNDEMLAISMGNLQRSLAEMNVEAKFTVFDSGVEANQAFASGSIDFASMGITNAVIAMAKKLPVQLIWIHEILGTNEGLVVQKDRGISKIDDLRGKVVATTFASTSHFSLLKTLVRHNLVGAVTLLDMKSTDIAAAWQRGDIDGAYTWEPALNTIQNSGGITLITSRELAATGNPTANVMLGRRAFTERNPDITEAFLAAVIKANQFYRSHPDEAAKILAPKLEISPELAALQMSGSQWLDLTTARAYFGSGDGPGKLIEVLHDLSEFLHQIKTIPHVPDRAAIREFVNGEFLPEPTKN